MTTAPRSEGFATTTLHVGHLLVGVSALVFSAVLIRAALAPGAELESLYIVPGLLLAVAASAFTYAAVLVMRRGRRSREGRGSRGGSLHLGLAVVELVAGGLMVWGLVVAVQGYGGFQPWRSPLLLPMAVLLGLGIWGIWLDGPARRR